YAQLLISPDWHHEGRLLATDEELLVLDTVTNEREFLRVEGLFPAWHPTQNRLLFSQRGGIVLHDFELDESVSITFPTVRALHPDWHPTDNAIIFTGRFRGVTPVQDRTFILDLDCVEAGNYPEQPVEIGADLNHSNPSWNSTGEYILVQEEVAFLQYETIIMDRQGQIIRRLTPEGEEDNSAVWGPCDRYVLVAREGVAPPAGNFHIIDLMTDEITQIMAGRGGGPSWWWDADEIDCEPFEIEAR
ncbi:MAG: hypothetical protein AAFV33_27555, partial [Chloroflexota bacterium]